MTKSLLQVSCFGAAACAVGAALTDCRGQTTGADKAGNLTLMSYHIHYTTNTTGQKLFYEAFLEEFGGRFPFPPGGDPLCPFGPNYGAEEYAFVCSLEAGYEEFGADAVVFGPPGAAKNLGAGPWGVPQRAFFIPRAYIGEAWAWAQENRFHTDVLRHPNSGCMHDDHSVRAVWVAENPEDVPSIAVAEFPCNFPGTGCNDTLFAGPPACGCSDLLPLPDDAPENSCMYCIANGGFVDDLSFECSGPHLDIFYKTQHDEHHDHHPPRHDHDHSHNHHDQHHHHDEHRVMCGSTLREHDVQAAPAVAYPEAQDGKYYTLIVVDPDADALSPVRHWVVGNLDAEGLRRGCLKSGFTASNFTAPQDFDGVHRLGQFLFEQPGEMELDFTEIESDASQWDYKGFLGFYGLGGKLVASNWHGVESCHKPPVLLV